MSEGPLSVVDLTYFMVELANCKCSLKTSLHEIRSQTYIVISTHLGLMPSLPWRETLPIVLLEVYALE